MRSGHCLTREHLFRLKLRDDPLCDCGSVDHLDHIFFECPIHCVPTFNIYEELRTVGVKTPMNMHVVLGHPTEKSINIIIKFLAFNKLEL